MGKNWKVCELDDAESISQRFSVASVPDTWIMRQEDGSLKCYWPKNNAAGRIRSLRAPKEGDKCTYFKCRVLMNGAKFSSFKEAKHAELIAQNSSIIDSSAVTKTICNSTMEFVVSDIDMKEKKDSYSHGSSMNFDVTNANVTEFIGNDSCGYNKAILNGSRILKKPRMFVEDLQLNAPKTNLPRVVNDSKLSESLGYDVLFSSSNDFLTSTILDGNETIKNVDDFDDFILSKVSVIASKISIFVQTIREALSDIKASVSKRHEIALVQNDSTSSFEKVTLTSPDHESASSIEVFAETNNENNASKEKGFQSFNDDADRTYNQRAKVLNVEILNLQMKDDRDVPSADQTLKKRFNKIGKEPTILNETFVATSPHCDASKCFKVPNIEDETNPETPNDPEQTPGEKCTTTHVVLPNDQIEEFLRNEDLLEMEEVLKEDLTKQLCPSDEEDETQYMNRTIFTVFTENFLLNHVSWKDGKDHVNIKHSNLLSCWKESYEKKFKPDVKGERYKYHIRRVKSARRASIKKAKEKLIRQSDKTTSVKMGSRK